MSFCTPRGVCLRWMPHRGNLGGAPGHFHESGFFTFLLAECPFQKSLFSLRIMIFSPSNLLSTFLCLKFHFNSQNEDCAHWCVRSCLQGLLCSYPVCWEVICAGGSNENAVSAKGGTGTSSGAQSVGGIGGQPCKPQTPLYFLSPRAETCSPETPERRPVFLAISMDYGQYRP